MSRIKSNIQRQIIIPIAERPAQPTASGQLKIVEEAATPDYELAIEQLEKATKSYKHKHYNQRATESYVHLQYSQHAMLCHVNKPNGARLSKYV